MACLFTCALSTPLNIKTITIKYDDLKFDPINTRANTIDPPYNYLAFPGFVGRVDDPASVQKARSPKNEIGSVVLLGPAAISSYYNGSTVSSFALLSTYIGCVPTDLGAAGVPEPCTLGFVGHTATSSKTVTGSCKFTGSELNPDLQLCILPSTFTGLKSVHVNVTVSLSTPATTTFILDDTTVKITF
ncbi:MAG: hypothetical protein Q9190_004011 [Brigantiaea leucoxantha]